MKKETIATVAYSMTLGWVLFSHHLEATAVGISSGDSSKSKAKLSKGAGQGKFREDSMFARRLGKGVIARELFPQEKFHRSSPLDTGDLNGSGSTGQILE